MFATIILSIFLEVSVFAIPDAASDFHYIRYINSQQTSWKAGLNFPWNRTHSYFASKPSLQLNALNQSLPVLTPFVKTQDLPLSFDCREKWPDCKTINDIRDQSRCEASWAFAPAAVISDRICIHSGNHENFYASAEELIECCSDCAPKGPCRPGFVDEAFKYWIEQGLVSGNSNLRIKTCLPFVFPTFLNKPTLGKREANARKCLHKCQEGYEIPFQKDKHYGRIVYSVPSDEKSIMNEIIENGPVQSAIILHPDFYYYKSGIYRHIDKRVLGGHAVKIIGWGEEEHIPFWIVANNFGRDFGENGFIRILRGSNECAIESNINAGIPKQKY